MRFEIDSLLVVRVFNDGETIPILEQPTLPDGTPFADYASAEQWAQDYIAQTLAYVDPVEELPITEEE